MTTRTPVLLGTSWTLVYNATSAGDFNGIIQQTGGAADAILHVASSSPAAGDGGFIPDGGLPVSITQASGLKIYGRSPSATATVVMTTNIGPFSSAPVTPSTVVIGGVIASDGVSLPIPSLAQTLGYTGSNLTTITVSYGGSSYVQTLTYTGSNVTAISQWVKQ